MKKAFTLSEILITLTIIGVVAAMTLPTLIGKYKEKQTITAVKVAYSVFSQAIMQMVNDYGSLNAWRQAQPRVKTRTATIAHHI